MDSTLFKYCGGSKEVLKLYVNLKKDAIHKMLTLNPLNPSALQLPFL